MQVSGYAVRMADRKKTAATKGSPAGKAKRGPSKRRSATVDARRELRRSPCPVACTLDLIGDRWTMLVIRDLFLGRSRFRDFLASPEGIPTNILTERLERLVAAGLVERTLAADGSGRPAYRLTDAGSTLAPVLRALRDWGLAHVPGAAVRLEPQSPR